MSKNGDDESDSSTMAVSAAQILSAPLPPTTTAEQNLRTAGQREVNMIWEKTQSLIARFLVFATVLYSFVLLAILVFVPAVDPQVLSAMAATGVLGNAFFLVIGFYFGRTNHARIGDEVPKKLGLDDRP